MASASVPVPMVGSVTVATVWSLLTSTVAWPSKRPGRAAALFSSDSIAETTLGAVTSSALTTTSSMLPSLGKAAWMRS